MGYGTNMNFGCIYKRSIAFTDATKVHICFVSILEYNIFYFNIFFTFNTQVGVIEIELLRTQPKFILVSCKSLERNIFEFNIFMSKKPNTKLLFDIIWGK